MGLIYSWKILETDVGLSLDAESYFILESQKNISPPEVPMSGLRGKIKTSTSRGDFLSGPGNSGGGGMIFQGMHRLVICGHIPGRMY